MARHDDGHRVLAHRLPHRAGRPGRSGQRRQLAVADRLAGPHAAQGVVHAPVERRQPRVSKATSSIGVSCPERCARIASTARFASPRGRCSVAPGALLSSLRRVASSSASGSWTQTRPRSFQAAPQRPIGVSKRAKAGGLTPTRIARDGGTRLRRARVRPTRAERLCWPAWPPRSGSSRPCPPLSCAACGSHGSSAAPTDAGPDASESEGDSGLPCDTTGLSKGPWVLHVDGTSAIVRWETCRAGRRSACRTPRVRRRDEEGLAANESAFESSTPSRCSTPTRLPITRAPGTCTTRRSRGCLPAPATRTAWTSTRRSRRASAPRVTPATRCASSPSATPPRAGLLDARRAFAHHAAGLRLRPARRRHRVLRLAGRDVRLLVQLMPPLIRGGRSCPPSATTTATTRAASRTTSTSSTPSASGATPASTAPASTTRTRRAACGF